MTAQARPAAAPAPAWTGGRIADGDEHAPRRVLLISYQFPPTGGAGVQRITKFVKYLPHCGWLPSVLTVANPSVPVRDESLSADVPADTIVRRARTWEPGYAVKAAVSADGENPTRRAGLASRLLRGTVHRLSKLLLQPDPQVLWAPQALRQGERLLRQVPHHAILASGPPFSTFLVGAALSRRTGLPLVLDYRDEWDLSNAYLENKRFGALSRWFQGALQRRAVRSAKALLATTRASAGELERVRLGARSAAGVTHIYNGFDPDDFPVATGPRDSPSGCCRLVYVGTLWELTSAVPLVEAVHALARRRPDLAARLELVFAGRCTAAQEQLLGRLRDLPCSVTRHPYLPHRRAIDLMCSADVLCVLLTGLPGAGRVMPAKVFEYMATGRPVLAVAPRGELWDLMTDYPAGHCLTPDEPEAIAAYLAGAIEDCAGPAPRPAREWDAQRYSRPHQTRQLAALLDGIRG